MHDDRLFPAGDPAPASPAQQRWRAGLCRAVDGLMTSAEGRDLLRWLLQAGLCFTAGRPAAPGQTSAEGQEKQPAADDAARLEAHLRQTDALRRARWQQQVEQWRQEVADDPQLGGEHLAATVARAQLALDRFDTDKSIGRLLEESGYGNHPAVLRFFSRLADSLLEDSLPGSEGGGSLPPLEERMYAGWSSQRS